MKLKNDLVILKEAQSNCNHKYLNFEINHIINKSYKEYIFCLDKKEMTKKEILKMINNGVFNK